MEKPSNPPRAISSGLCLGQSSKSQERSEQLVLPQQNIITHHEDNNNMSATTSLESSSHHFFNDGQQQIATGSQSQEQQPLQQRLEAFDTSFITNNNEAQFLHQSAADLSTLQAVGAMVNVNEKISIYRHPLFPLLKFLFEKCEVATNSIENATAMNFQDEIKNLISQMAKDNKLFFTDDVEVNTLMLKALQVLTIHLLELEKVNELCKDFCTRYISCLKGKLNSENIMRTLDIPSTPPASPTHGVSNHPHQETGQSQLIIDSSTLSSPPHPTMLNLPGRSASTSCMEMNPAKEHFSINRSVSTDSSRLVSNDLNGMTVEQLTSGFLTKKNKGGKRGTLPKQATNVLKAWLFQHLVHPYPSEEEKKQLAQQTNLSILQVNNWFINARRRIIQPMLDSSNTLLKNNKKSKQPRNAAQKGWSNTMEVYSAAFRPQDVSNVSHTQQQQQQQQSHQQQQPVGLVVSPVLPAAGTVLLNLSDAVSSQPVILTQPMQFVQVSHVPTMQAIAPSGYLPLQTMTTQATSTAPTTLHSSINSQASKN